MLRILANEILPDVTFGIVAVVFALPPLIGPEINGARKSLAVGVIWAVIAASQGVVVVASLLGYSKVAWWPRLLSAALSVPGIALLIWYFFFQTGEGH